MQSCIKRDGEQFCLSTVLRKSVAFLMQGDALVLQGFAKFTSLQIKEILYLVQFIFH
jgi:hypothetical protein